MHLSDTLVANLVYMASIKGTRDAHLCIIINTDLLPQTSDGGVPWMLKFRSPLLRAAELSILGFVFKLYA